MNQLASLTQLMERENGQVDALDPSRSTSWSPCKIFDEETHGQDKTYPSLFIELSLATMLNFTEYRLNNRVQHNQFALQFA